MACRRLGCGSPLEMVHARQVLEAKRALLYSHMSVAEIGRSLGFDDTAYFVRLFRRREGMAPGQFRIQRSNQPVLGAD
jgi:AraC family transcriptional activator of pobA